MIDGAALLSDLRKQVKLLEGDLLARSIEDEQVDTRFRAEWQTARDVDRTALSFESWRDDRITHVAVAWVLGTVFLRFCEDNGLIELPYLAGPGERLEIAQERQTEFFRLYPDKTDRDWVLEGFRALSASPVAAGLFDQSHNPMWTANPSHEATKGLLSFWRSTGLRGEIVHSFIDDSWDTNFLGDIYQELSSEAKKTYALLQTPQFVVDFILDRTLEPAIDEHGLHGLRLIDPACGSGHFLLGLFDRLFSKWQASAPGADSWDLVNRVLTSVHGVDKNPFAVVIARFRLLVAAMHAGGVRLLSRTPDFSINVAAGDSLLHGRGVRDLKGRNFYFAYEDVDSYVASVDILGKNSYHVVVGNPPYITVKDKQENDNYRDLYGTCVGKYALSVPFAERFFQLAVSASVGASGSGYVGQITANSFMKREFGRKIVEDLFALRVDLTYIVDTSLACIPGHGTPTVILIGRNRPPVLGSRVRTTMGIRGRPADSVAPALGCVWRAIVDQVDQPGSESEWVSSVDTARDQLVKHPWSLAGGGAEELRRIVEISSSDKLYSRVDSIGIVSFTLGDELYRLSHRSASRRGISLNWRRSMVVGDALRDWMMGDLDDAIFPYDGHLEPVDVENYRDLLRYMWPGRTVISNSYLFGRVTKVEAGLKWSEYGRLTGRKLQTSTSIAFPFVGTHNHFVFDRCGHLFNRTAPVIKLPVDASEEDHLGLLGLLNSSVACFWLKQVCYPKGGDPAGDEGARVSAEVWADRYEFTGTKLREFPLPRELPLKFGRELDNLAQQLSAVEPRVVCTDAVPNRQRLDAAKAEYRHRQYQMIASQEELDWEVYRLYGILDETDAVELCSAPPDVPGLKFGERAFEIVLARKMAAGDIETQWFVRHGATPVTELPSRWPESYRRVVQKRIETIERRRDIALIERPECKRRWASVPWEKKEKEALRTWLLDRSEERELWFAPNAYGTTQPKPLTLNQLADKLRLNADVVDVARLYAGHDGDFADVLAEIVADEHVPYLAGLRYKDTGLRKRAQWENVWRLQRREDETGERLDVQVPPKYASADFRKPSYWRNRGKLDVPKERFISYLDAGTEADRSVLLGWAGWDHREQAHVLMTLIEERTTVDGWGKGQLTPLIAGLAEVMPWVKQWHSDINPDFGQSWAEAYQQYLEAQQLRHGLTDEDLQAWRPVANSSRGRRSKKA